MLLLAALLLPGCRTASYYGQAMRGHQEDLAAFYRAAERPAKMPKPERHRRLETQGGVALAADQTEVNGQESDFRTKIVKVCQLGQIVGMATKTMNISLTPYWQGYVEQHLREGRYQNASELMREALRSHEREQMALEVGEVNAFFGAAGRAESATEIEQIKRAAKAVRKELKGRSR